MIIAKKPDLWVILSREKDSRQFDVEDFCETRRVARGERKRLQRELGSDWIVTVSRYSESNL